MRYDIESLTKMNFGYDSMYNVSQSDVDKANKYVTLIETTRSDTHPKAGDLLRYTNEHGDYYGCAHIESNRDGVCNICERPYVPFIYEDGNKGIHCNTSGGAWAGLNAGDIRYAGKAQKTFCDWGHCGACASGAIHFSAEVSVWEYIHPEPLYGDFTSEKWRKLYVSKLDEENRRQHGGYLYLADSALASECGKTAFRTEEEFSTFLRTYKATLFPGHWPNSQIMWCYRIRDIRVSQEEYDSLDLPVISIYCNGKRPAKIEYDNQHKIARNYFVMQDQVALNTNQNHG